MTSSGRLRAMFAAALISVAGSQLTYVAIPWFVLQTTGSATRTGVVFAVELIAGAACGIPSGAVVERLGARRTLLLADALAVPLIATIPIAHGQGWLSFPLICAISAGTGMLSPAYLAATTVALTGLVGEDEELLTRANGHLAVIQQTGALGGKAVAGLLVALMGATNVLSIDAASYAVSFLILLAALPSHSRSATGPATETSSSPAGLLAGLRFLLRHPVIRPSVASIMVVNFAFQALMVAVPVAISRDGYDARWYGWTMASWGAGMIAGGLLVGRLVKRIAPLLLVCCGAAGLALGAVVLVVLGSTPPDLMAAFVVLGVSNSVIDAPFFAILTVQTPAMLRPKVFTALMTLSTISAPVGALAAGPLLDQYGARTTFVFCAAAIFVAMAAAISLWLAEHRRRTRDSSRSAISASTLAHTSAAAPDSVR